MDGGTLGASHRRVHSQHQQQAVVAVEGADRVVSIYPEALVTLRLEPYGFKRLGEIQWESEIPPHNHRSNYETGQDLQKFPPLLPTLRLPLCGLPPLCLPHFPLKSGILAADKEDHDD